MGTGDGNGGKTGLQILLIVVLVIALILACAVVPLLLMKTIPGSTNMNPPVQVAQPNVTMQIIGCTTGFDVTHGLGEVTNVYVRVMNTGDADARFIYLTTSASDEGQPHPNKTAYLAFLPIMDMTVVKLTVDTTF